MDGAYRVFHDVRSTAIGIAYNLQAKNRGSVIEIQDNATGDRVRLLPDGRFG